MNLTLHDHVVIFFSTLVELGLPVTLKLVVGSFLGASVIGLFGGIVRGLRIPVLNQIFGFYAQIFRAIPEMLVLLFLYAVIAFGSTYSISVLAISLVQGAYMQEIIKGGILHVDRGQWEAAKSMSLPIHIVLFRIIIPQVMLVALPALIGQVVLLIKGTSVASTIGCMELTKRGTIAMARYSNALVIYGYILIIFFILCHSLAMLGKKLENTVVRKTMGDYYER